MEVFEIMTSALVTHLACQEIQEGIHNKSQFCPSITFFELFLLHLLPGAGTGTETKTKQMVSLNLTNNKTSFNFVS